MTSSSIVRWCLLCLISASSLFILHLSHQRQLLEAQGDTKRVLLNPKRVDNVVKERPDQNEPPNLLLNPSLEDVSLTTLFRHTEDDHYTGKRFAVEWEPFLNPYVIDDAVSHWGGRSMRIESGFVADKFGALQCVHFDAATSSRFVNVRVWVRGRQITGLSDDAYAVYVNFHFRNGSNSYGNTIQLPVGSTPSWQAMARSWTIGDEIQLSHICVFLIWAERSGTVWVDDLYLSMTNVSMFATFAPHHGVMHTCCPFRNVMRAADVPARDSISIVSQLSVDRLPALLRMIQIWRGPITVAVFVLRDANVQDVLRLVSSNELVRKHVTFVLVWSDAGSWSFEHLGFYPINTLRNAAANATTSRWGMFLDIDFVPNLSADETWQEFKRRGLDALSVERKAVLVVPAFEFVDEISDADAIIAALPRRKHELLDAVALGTVRQVHGVKYAPAHNATNYPRWYEFDEPYTVDYEHEYEPYFVAHIADLPRWDERFVGYGYDKVIHILTVFVRGDITLMVQPRLFTTHIDHGLATWRKASPMLRVRVYQNYYTAMEELVHQFGADAFRRIK